MKLFLCGLMLVIAFGCSHHHKNKDHHHHDKKAACNECNSKSTDQYEKNCAHSVLEGKPHKVENDNFKLVHGGRTYYFASQEKLDKFKQNLKENVLKADKQWENSSSM